MDAVIETVEGVNEVSAQLKEGLTASNAHMATVLRVQGGNLLNDIFHGHEAELAVIGVTEGAAEVAPAKAHEHHGRSRPETLSLKAVEYLVDFIHYSALAAL